MLNWALTFLIIALVASLFGFGNIAGLSMEFAQILFLVALIVLAFHAVARLTSDAS